MLIARCISALRGGAANQRGRSPHSDSEQLPTSLTPPSHTPTATTAPTASCLSQQQLQAVNEPSQQQRPTEVKDEDEKKLHITADETPLCYLRAVCMIRVLPCS